MASFTVSSGQTVTGAVISSVFSADGGGHGETGIVLSGGIVSNTLVVNGGQLQLSGGAAYNTSLTAMPFPGGSMIVRAGGVGIGTTVGNQSLELVLSGGSETNAFISGRSADGSSTSGLISVTDGGALAGTIIDGGSVIYTITGTARLDAILTDSGFTDPVTGKPEGALVKQGSGTLVIGSSNPNFSGTLAISGGGTVELAVPSAAGAASIVFDWGKLRIDGTAMPTNTIAGLTTADTVDLANVTFDGSGSVQLISGNVLQVKEGGKTYSLQLDPSQDFTGNTFLLAADAGGGTLITESGPAHIVNSGQTSSGVVLNSGDFETVLVGGSAVSTTVNSGASLIVSGGVEQGATINGGSESVSAFGGATSDTINSGGTEIVSGGALGEATVNNGGRLFAQEGSTPFNIHVNTGGSLFVGGGIGRIDVSGGDADGGAITVSSGGSIEFVTVENSGSLTLVSGGFISTGILAGFGTSDTIGAGGMELVSAGGLALAETINSGGTLVVLSGGLAGAFLFRQNVAPIINAGGVEIVSSGGGTSDPVVFGAIAVLAGGSAGVVNIESGGSGSFAGSAGFISLSSGGQATVAAGAVVSDILVASGGVVTNPSFVGQLDLRAGAIVSGGITFLSGAFFGTPPNVGNLRIGGTTMPTNTISGFVSGDTIDLANIAFDPSGSAVLGAGNMLVTEGGVTYNLQLSPAQLYGAFRLSPDSGGGTLIAEDPVCFCRGTMIRTERGEMPVEELNVGDLVRTLSGKLKPIVWIGVGGGLVTRGNRLARPIIVAAGALADGVPADDLHLTHGHALYFAADSVLIPVEHLVNHRSIRWDETARAVEYYHIELADHDVVLANGAPAESYYDARNRARFRNTRPGSRPGAAQPTCARVLNSGEVVERTWARLFERCGGPIAVATTVYPDLHLVVDGVRRNAIRVEAEVFTFVLDRPPGRALLLRSRSGVPSLIGINRADHRPLGIAIRQIILEQGGIATRFDHDAPQLREGGCYLPEAGFSWTDGEFALPPRFFPGRNGRLTLTVHTKRQGLKYPLPAAVAAVA